MPGRDPLKTELAALHALRSAPRAPASLESLRKILRGNHSHAIAVAAEIVGEAGLRELASLLAPAFERLVGAPGTDPNARAKTAIAVALQRLEDGDAAFFLRGISMRQWEPVYGGSVEVAAELRSACALGLAATGDARALPALAELLVDLEWPARAGAARALGATGRSESELLLRYKALVGDPEPQVATEVFGAIIGLAPRNAPSAGIDFVARFLDEPAVAASGRMHAIAAAELEPMACTACGGHAPRAFPETTAEAASLALGQSRRSEALAPLRRYAESRPGERARVGLLSIAMLRVPEATEYLVALVAEAPTERAAQAVAALAIHHYDEALSQRVRSTVDTRKSRVLANAFAEAFKTP